MARQFAKNELAVAIHSCYARCGLRETQTLTDFTIAALTASEKEKRSSEMEANNRSSDVPLEYYERLLTGVKSTDAQNTLVEDLAALYRAEDRAKRNQTGEN